MLIHGCLRSRHILASGQDSDYGPTHGRLDRQSMTDISLHSAWCRSFGIGGTTVYCRLTLDDSRCSIFAAGRGGHAWDVLACITRRSRSVSRGLTWTAADTPTLRHNFTAAYLWSTEEVEFYGCSIQRVADVVLPPSCEQKSCFKVFLPLPKIRLCLLVATGISQYALPVPA